MTDDENRRSDLRGRVSEEYGTVSNCGASSRESSRMGRPVIRHGGWTLIGAVTY